MGIDMGGGAWGITNTETGTVRMLAPGEVAWLPLTTVWNPQYRIYVLAPTSPSGERPAIVNLITRTGAFETI